MKLASYLPSLLIAAMVAAVAPAALAGSHSGSKTRSYGNDFLGLKETPNYLLSNSATGPSYARARANASLSFLGILNLPIAEARASAYSNVGGATKVTLIGTTVWSKAIPTGPSALISSPIVTRSVFGSHPPSIVIALGPFDVSLSGNAGSAGKEYFHHQTAQSTRRIVINGQHKVWAYASGSVGVGCPIAEIGVTLTENFAKSWLNGLLDAKASGLSGTPTADFTSSCLELTVWVELFWCDVYETTLVDQCTSAATYNVW